MLTGDYKGGTAKRIGCGVNTDESRAVKIVFFFFSLCFFYLRGGVDPQGSRMIKCLQLQSDILECTNTRAHTHLQTPRLAWMSTQACCSGLSADGCLLGPWALWGPQETSQEKHWTGLCFVTTAVILSPAFTHNEQRNKQSSTTTMRQITEIYFEIQKKLVNFTNNYKLKVTH